MRTGGERMKDGEKIVYCYNCQSQTIYSSRDTHGNSGVESHCTSCGWWFEWQNRAVEREKEKWIQFNDNRRNIPINNKLMIM